MNETDLNKLLRDYRSLELQSKALSLEMDIIKEALRNYMQDGNLDKVEVTEGQVSLTRSVRVSYDKAVLEKTFTEAQLSEARKESEVTTLRITPNKE